MKTDKNEKIIAKLNEKFSSRAEDYLPKEVIENIQKAQKNIIEVNSLSSPQKEEKRKVLNLIKKLEGLDTSQNLDNPTINELKKVYKINKWYIKLIKENLKIFGFGLSNNFLYIQDNKLEESIEVHINHILSSTVALKEAKDTLDKMNIPDPKINFIISTGSNVSIYISSCERPTIFFLNQDRS